MDFQKLYDKLEGIIDIETEFELSQIKKKI